MIKKCEKSAYSHSKNVLYQPQQKFEMWDKPFETEIEGRGFGSFSKD
jgi:hypothetical protein